MSLVCQLTFCNSTIKVELGQIILSEVPALHQVDCGQVPHKINKFALWVHAVTIVGSYLKVDLTL